LAAFDVTPEETNLANILVPAFAFGRDPQERIISVSYGSELSETWGRRVRNLLGDPSFAEIFPNCKLSPDSAAVYRFETSRGGEYSATGRGGPITGKGASLLILDDLIKDSSEANSEATNKATIDWLQSTALTRLTPNGRVLAIGTRWSEKDPLGWLLQQRGFEVLRLPAFAEEDDPLGRDPGEALWPTRYPVSTLDEIRADIGSRNFQVLYQGNPSAAEGTIFKREWFRHYQQPPEKYLRVIQSWDTAFKTGATNDYSVCATIGETANGFYLLHLYRAKVEFPELKRMVTELAEQWKPSDIFCEEKASGTSLVQELKISTIYPVIPVQVDRDKETRASAVTGYFEAGRVLFPENAPWLADLEDELAAFPGGLHDDQVDAITQALNKLRGSTGIFGVIEIGLQMLRPSKVVQFPQPPKQDGPCCPNRFKQFIPGGRAVCGNCRAPWIAQAIVIGERCSCDPRLHVSIGFQKRCNQCGRQFYPQGVQPRTPYRATRGDLPRTG
jgi:predicted phage terminase large subunit-like protein